MEYTNSIKCAAIILAGGSSTRMGGRDKQLIEIEGVPVIVKSALIFERTAEVTEIIIAARKEEKERIESLCESFGITKLKAVTEGGATRAESARKAFAFVKNADIVAVHDGARPFATTELAQKVILAAKEQGAAIPAIAVKDTIKEAEAGFVKSTPDRSTLFCAQTPQAFKYEVYEKMIAGAEEATDDAALAEKAGYPVKIVEGEESNIKITTLRDLEKTGAERSKCMLRIGHGYDVHRLTENRRLILGGVEIPYELGLLGHSDADVLVHAVMDALLGALALGDIGKHFPDTDNQYKDIDSMLLLEKVWGLVTEKGYRLVNLDVTIKAEKPKLAKYIPTMCENIAAALGTQSDNISIKATTEEGLGLAGAGIGAHCVCLLERV
ncbi:MAG: 2-C-methyl-D-erythritol 2,4-cyclodiphosphate synthase [Ruminiclostridium sp.]